MVGASSNNASTSKTTLAQVAIQVEVPSCFVCADALDPDSTHTYPVAMDPRSTMRPLFSAPTADRTVTVDAMLWRKPAQMDVTTTVCFGSEGGGKTTGVGTVWECSVPRPS
jgi:hypothetical protein